MPDKPRIICYTAIFGDSKDQLQELPVFTDVEFHAYVDTVSGEMPHQTGWTLRPAHFHGDNPRRKARQHKVLAHELYPELGPGGYTIWLDGTMTPNLDPHKLVQRYLCSDYKRFESKELAGSTAALSLPDGLHGQPTQQYMWDVATFRHSSRGCVYEEAEAICRARKDDIKTVRDQMRRYHDEKYPHHNGLAETMVVMRRHTDAVAQLNNVWWSEIVNGSLRDQLSFDRACWATGSDYRRFDFPYSEQKDFDFKGHW